MTQAANKVAGLVARIQERFPRLIQRVVERARSEQVGEGWDVQLSRHMVVVVVRPIQQWQAALEEPSKEPPVPPILGLPQSAAPEADWQPNSFLRKVTPPSDITANTSLKQRTYAIIDALGELFSVVWPDVAQPVVSHVLEAD